MPAITPADKERAVRIAVAALARGATNAEAANRAEIAIRTLVSWKQDKAFRAQVEQERDRLSEHEPEAIALLRRAIHDATVTATQIRAAEALIRALPDESPQEQQPTIVQLHLPADVIREVEEHRRADAREASRLFHEAQARQAEQARRLYSASDE